MIMIVFQTAWVAVLLLISTVLCEDLEAAASVAAKSLKMQATGQKGKYGYPYLIAPTLTPLIHSRSDDDSVDVDFKQLRKESPKKKKAEAERRLGHADEERRRYREPKYRNLDELESRFMPRRMDYRDPYSKDSFYPAPSYKHSGRNPPLYGAGYYDVPPPYYGGNGYDPHQPPHYPEHDDHYQEDYTIESNKPIVGDIRKRLLDYAGASDLYEGEPDYLRHQVSHKYGPVDNDYYAYGGPEYKRSYRDFPYVESKVSLIRKSRRT